MSKDRAEINRANAQHSTGPRTDEGKKHSSLNALRHGLTSRAVVLPSEDHAEYEGYAARFMKEFDPQGAAEVELVELLIDTAWRLNRILVLETEVLGSGSTLESRVKSVATLGMHGQRLSRQLERTMAQLRDLQNTRKAAEQTAIEQMVDVVKMYEMKGEDYDPSDDGFVFSEAQLDAALQARFHQNIAARARKFIAEA